MHKIYLFLLFFVSLSIQLMAHPHEITLKTSKLKGERIDLKMVAGGNVKILIGDVLIQTGPVSKDFRRPSSHSFPLPIDNAEIKILASNLTYIDCSANGLTQLDVSNNPSLRTLLCQNNQLSELDVRNNPNLSLLWCMSNQLSQLDLKSNPELKQLSFVRNHITSIDVSNNSKLQTILCAENRLGKLDVSNNPLLRNLDARNTGINSLDLSRNEEIISVSIHNNGHNNANSFTASSLNDLYNSLPISLGIINITNSKYNSDIDNDAKASDITLAAKKGWLVYDKGTDKKLTPSPDLEQEYETSTISITIRKNRIVQLTNKLTNSTWSFEQNPVFHVDTPGIEANLDAVVLYNNQIKLRLTLKNSSDETLFPEPVFPQIKGAHIEGKNPADLYYLFPGQGYGPSNNEPVDYIELYSAAFPLQFMDAYHKNDGGFYLMTQDATNYGKSYSLSKKQGEIDMRVTFKSKELKPGEEWKLPAVVIGAHKDDWHAALSAYRDWLGSWYKPHTSRKKWFRDVFNFRQVFVHRMFGEPGVYDPATNKIDLVSRLEADIDAFGGVDYVHIFDWMKTPNGRILDYDPWDYLGGHEALANQINLIQDSGLRVGIYFEGYIMNKKSRIGLMHGDYFQQLDIKGNPYTKWGTGNYYPCPSVPEFQDYISNLVNHTSALLGTNGIYLDQYGFGYQYGCFNPAHSHASHHSSLKNGLQVSGESNLAKAVKNKIPGEQVLYIEDTPTDVSTQYYDGSFSYTIQKTRIDEFANPSRINFTRFAIPDFKTFEILKTDRPLGNDQEGVKHVFFNGNGIWLAGPLNDPNWFPEEFRKTVRKTHKILRTYKDAFTSLDPVPLVPVLQKQVYANYFPSDKHRVWTLFNANEDSVSGSIIKIKHIEGSIYYDAWNEKRLNPEIKDGFAVIETSIKGRDTGCIVQELQQITNHSGKSASETR